MTSIFCNRSVAGNGLTLPNSAIPPVNYFASIWEKLRNISQIKPGLLSSKSITVLLADDDADDRQLFLEALQEISPAVNLETADNGTELLDKLKRGVSPEVIFLDLNMPGKNGRECLSEIRAGRIWRDVPVVIYSTSSNKKDIQETYQAGANLYLLKPSSFSDLINLIRDAFNIDWQTEQRRELKDYLLKKL